MKRNLKWIAYTGVAVMVAVACSSVAFTGRKECYFTQTLKFLRFQSNPIRSI